MNSSYDEEHRLLYLLGLFNPELAQDCMNKASDSCECPSAPYPISLRPIKSHRSSRTIAFRIQLKNPCYFLLSHPISRFRGAENYFIGGEETGFCAKLRLIPAYLVNLNKFTLLRVWGDLAQRLFSNTAEPIPMEEQVYWKLCPKTTNFPELSSANFVLRQTSEFREYLGKYSTLFDDYFTFSFWSFPENGFSNSTIVLNDSESVHTVLKATKTIYIPLKTYYKSMRLGKENDIDVKVASMYGLTKNSLGYELRHFNDVVLTHDIAESLEYEQSRGHVLINGIVSDFIRRSTWFPTLTAVKLYEVSSCELLMSIIGIVVNEKFNEGQSMALIGTVEEIKKEVNQIVELIQGKAYLDSTITDGFDDQIALAIECLRPILAIDQENLYYMHPSVFVALLEAGLDNVVEKHASLVAVLKLIDKMPTTKDDNIASTAESTFLRKTGHFPERIVVALRTAAIEMSLARLLKNPNLQVHVTNLSNENKSPSGKGKEEKHKAKITSNPDINSIDIEDEGEQDILDQVKKLNKKIKDFERDGQ